MTLKRILIVDDDPQIQTMLRIGLESAGYETRPALTGHEAVRLAASIAPDAILLDLGLPDRDGKDVLTGHSRLLPGADHHPVSPRPRGRKGGGP